MSDAPEERRQAAADVLVDLNRFLSIWDAGDDPAISPDTVRAACDEIVALRKGHDAKAFAACEREISRLEHENRDLRTQAKIIRAEALEEAARVCEDLILQQRTPELRRSLAAAIRGLKERP